MIEVEASNPLSVTSEERKMILRNRKVRQHEEYRYLHLLEDIMETGSESDDRTGVGTKKIFGTQLKFSLRDSFPILTTKRVFWRGVVEELLWFIRGETNANLLAEKKIDIWTGNTTREFLDNRKLQYPEGYIGPGYGWQWRHWNAKYQICEQIEDFNGIEQWETCEFLRGEKTDRSISNTKKEQWEGIDQLASALYKLKHQPNDRRIIVSAWNPDQIDEMALPPCHILFQFQVNNGELHCQWYQRSVDSFLGLPFNISSYALLTCLFAKAAGLQPGELTFAGGDTHLYKNHFDQVKEQLSREPYPFPKLELPNIETLSDIENLTFEDCKLVDYKSHKSIKAEMAV